MRNQIEELKSKHELIERELIELETIIEAEIINYGNLVHVYNKLHDLWNKYEEKEEKIFPIMGKEGIKIPVKKVLFEHKVLRPHKEKMKKAIESGSEFEMRTALENNGIVIIKKLREHIEFEDEVLYRIMNGK